MTKAARIAATFASVTLLGSTLVASPSLAVPAGTPANINATTPGPLPAGTVPDGVCFVTATVRGGAGGSIVDTPNSNGAGAEITATFAVVPGQSYGGSVGGGGQAGDTNSAGGNGPGGIGGGGAGGTGGDYRGFFHHGAGGGGLSEFTLAGSTAIMAGGGGGTGGGHATNGGFGSDAGLPSATGVTAGSDGVDGFDEAGGVPGGGQGGQLTAAGLGGVHTTDGSLNGDAASGSDGGNGADDPDPDAGGGGGAGYFGGGGGAATSTYGVGSPVADGNAGGGGGGGASFIAATSPDGSGNAPTGISSAKGPQLADRGDGADGFIQLDWVMCDYDLAVAKTVTPSPVVTGATATWTVAVTNNGPDHMSRGDILTISDTLPGADAKTITDITISGGSNAVLDSDPITCDAAVGDAMPATLTCTRPYSALGADESPSGGLRGLNVGETVTVTYTQPISEAVGATLTNTATVDDRATGDSDDTSIVPLDVTEEPASIAGTVVDEHLVGIEGVAITATNVAGDIFTTDTAADGTYAFTGLPSGTYTVTETQPVGYGEGGQTTPWAGGVASTTNVISNLVLAPGDDTVANDFVETYASLAGTVFNDLNADGIQDAGDLGLSGVAISLTGTDAAGNAVTASATTDANGDYLITDLLGGTYTVTEAQPSGYADGIDTAGSVGGTAVNPGDEINSVALPAGTDATDYDFAEFVASSIAGTVVDDAGRPIAGVTITLTDGSGTTTTTTDGSGNYVFAGLAPGTYTVTETQPAGYGDGGETAGTVGGVDTVDDVISGIVLPAGTDATDYDFDETTGSLAGTVVDEYGAPIEGVQIDLTGTDANGLAVALQTFTAADGSYLFASLVGGTYTVTETQPTAYGDGPDTAGTAAGSVDSANDIISAIALAADQDATGYDFTEVFASIAGHTFIDSDLDGIYTPGTDVPLGGVEVTLTGTDDNGAITPVVAISATDGSYLFDDLRAGTYTVTETQPAGFVDGSDAAGTAGGTLTNDIVSAVALAGGVDATDYDFGEEPPGGISGTVLDENGVPIVGVSLTLTGADVNGNPVNLTTATDGGGAYSFSDLLPGIYTVTEIQPAGYDDVSTTAGLFNGDDSVENIVADIPIGSDPFLDSISTDNDFVEGVGSISGTVFNDVNNDGVQDAGELGISGVAVTLTGTNANGAAIDVTITTDGNGDYTFADLVGGNYVITEAQPSAYLDGVDTPGTGAAGTAVNPGDEINSIVLPGGEGAFGYDFGEIAASSISGTVNDENGAAIQSVALTLSGTDDLGNAVSATTDTLADGSYSFTGLRPGTYTVTETQPAGYDDVSTTAGNSGGVDTTENVISAIVLPTATDAVDYDFVEGVGSISGTVFNDVNNDGVQDVGELGISGVAVTLTGTNANGAAIDVTITTDGNGDYTFADLVGGNYVITEAQPSAYLDGVDTPGTGAAGTAVNPGDEINSIVLPGGIDAVDYDLGEIAASSISGTVTETDGSAIAAVRLTLSGTDDLGNTVSATTDTLADGSYSFTGLRPGTYTVTETQPIAFGDFDQSSVDPVADVSVTNVISNLVLEPGETNPDNDFIEERATISGSVFLDADNDGSYDLGLDLPIESATVTLTGTDVFGGTVSATASTGADGSYTFADLLAGDYTVTETQPAGYPDGLETAGTAGGTVADDEISAIPLVGGADEVAYDFGELSPFVIAGNVSAENAALGLDPLVDVEIQLTGTDDLGNPVALTTLTDASGDYAFSGIVPGSYTITQVQPLGYADLATVAGPEGAGDASIENIIAAVAVANDPALVEYGANNFVEAYSSLAGTVFSDNDDDSIQAADEVGIAGVEITLTGTDAAGNAVSATTTSDADGNYHFGDLLAGDYTLTETHPVAYIDGTDTAGTVGGTATNPGDEIAAIALPVGTAAADYDFAEVGTSLSGIVYVDANRDGAADSGEAAVADVVITLSDADGTVIATTTTDADGYYAFGGLPAGDYTVTQTQPQGYGSTTPSALAVAVPVDGLTDVDFGEDLGSIGDRVWLDSNEDGVQDAGEVGAPGVTLHLLDADGSVVATTTTDADGNYLFDGLQVGTYMVEVAPGTGRALTESGQAGAAQDSDPDWVTGSTGDITIDIEDCSTTVANGAALGRGVAAVTDPASCLVQHRTDVDAGLVEAVIDLAITGTVPSTPVAVGASVTFDYTPTNNSNVPIADGATVTVVFPAGLTPIEGAGPDWTVVIDGNTVTLELAQPLLPGDPLPPFAIQARVGSSYANQDVTATIGTLDGTAETTLANNATPLSITVIAGGPPAILAFTGTSLVGTLGLAGLLLLVGSALTVFSRRRLPLG